MSFEKTLFVACVTGKGDPAFDRRHPDYTAAVARYARTRHPAHLDAIPRREGMRPTLYGVTVLSAHARAVVLDAPGPAEQRLMAVRCGVVSVKRPDGVTADAPAESRGDMGRMAPASWVEQLAERGAYVVDELGHVVLHRAAVGDYDEAEGDDPLAPCGLPPGARLAL